MKNKPLLTAFLLLAAQQLAFLLFFPPFTEPDSATYIAVAQQYLHTGSLAADARLPGYPALLALSYSVFGPGGLPVVIFQHLLGLLLWYALVRMLEPGRQRLIFSGLYFCDLLYNSYQHAILADFVFSFLICMSAWAAWRYARDSRLRWTALCGLFVAMGVMTKPVLRLFPFFALPFFLLHRQAWGRRLAAAGLFLAGPLLAMNLWSLRNYLHEGYYALLPLESYHYVGRIVNHIEFPENSAARPYFQASMPEGRLPRDRKAPVVHAVVAAMTADGVPPAVMDREFRQIFRLSILRRPFSYLRESALELFYFFFSAHNLYAKYGLEGRLPVSAGDAWRSGDYGGLLLKLAVSMHPFYWLVFALFAWFTAVNARALLAGGDFFLLYSYSLILYIALVSSMANEGLARYRAAIQPLMLYAAAVMLARLLPGRGGADGGAR